MTDSYLTQFATIAVVHLLAVASPGPDFAVVVRQSVGYGRKTAVYTSLGVGTGIFVHVLYCLLGIGVVVSQSIIVFTVMKWTGAGYLFYIGVKALRTRPYAAADFPTAGRSAMRFSQAFRLGFLTNALNPKATLFFLSLFTVVIKHDTPLVLQASYGVYMAFATAVWFGGVSLFFGHHAVRRVFRRLGHWFERLMGAALVLLGIRLAVSVDR